MKTRFELVALLALALTTAGTATLAAESSAPPTTATSAAANSATSSASLESAASPGILDQTYLSVFSTFRAGSLSDLGSPYSYDNHGKITPSRTVDFDTEVGAGWAISPRFGMGVVVPFHFFPVMGKGFLLGDVGIKAYDRQTVVVDGLKIGTNLIVQAPTSDESRAPARSMDLALKTTPSIRYGFAGSRFAIGAWTEAKAYLGVASGKAFKLYAEPYVEYSLLPNLALNLKYEYEADDFVDKPGAPSKGFEVYQRDLQPGVVWNISKAVTVNPYLVMFISDEVSSERVAVAATISATIL